ncbi:MAG: sulfatase-like hydrolase/transferase [Acidimicrobiales bacterium]
MPTPVWRSLHLLALCTLAITQPLLGILGDNPTFFTAHGSSPAQVTWFALAVALAPAALLGAAEVTIHAIAPRLGDRVHLAIVAGLVFLVAIQVVDVLPGPWLVPVVTALAITGGLAVLYATNSGVRSAVSLLALTPVLFVALFLFVSPASKVVFPDDIDAVGLSDLVSEDSFTATVGVTDDGAEPIRASLADRVNERFPPVYLLVLDELPVASLLDETGAIDRARWPNFARLADTSHFFSNATTVGFTTERAVPAILTGRYETEAAPVYSLYPENLFTLLGDVYDISASDPLVDLCPPSVCDGKPPASIIELMASDVDPSEPTQPIPSTTTEAVFDETGSADGSSFRSLLDDAMIVFGHLATPEGLDIGLPDIGATWGDFGDDLGTEDRSTEDRSTAEAAAPAPAAPTPDAPAAALPGDGEIPIEIGPTPTPDADAVEIDAEAVNDENRATLDRLLTDDSRVADFRAELAAIMPSDVPRLHYLHILLPHVPWRLHGNGDTYPDIVLPGYSSAWDDDPTIARAGQQRHLLQLQFVDRLLGEYLDRLERAGVFDDATVVVVADHGISFVPGTSARGITEENVVGVAGVPLFYKLPDQRAGVHHREPVETTDIVPTIARQLEIDIPWGVDGVDLFGPRPDRDRLVHNTFSTWIPEPLPPLVAALTADLLATFGNGTDGSLYGLAGLHDRIGSPIGDLIDEPVGYCWLRNRPTAVPEADGEIGLVDGRLSTNRTEPIPFALTIGDTLTGTAMSLDHEGRHRVHALGDPETWSDATGTDVGLHEIVDDRLRPIPEC